MNSLRSLSNCRARELSEDKDAVTFLSVSHHGTGIYRAGFLGLICHCAFHHLLKLRPRGGNGWLGLNSRLAPLGAGRCPEAREWHESLRCPWEGAGGPPAWLVALTWKKWAVKR